MHAKQAAMLVMVLMCSPASVALRSVGFCALPQTVLPDCRGASCCPSGLAPRARHPSAGLVLRMAVGPIGPFNPFRSDSGNNEEIDREMGLLSYQATDLARRFQGITTGLTGGMMPDREAVKQLAEEMGSVNERWRVLLARFQLSSDFQQLELFKLTEARLAENDVSFMQMQESMAWQVEAMKKFAEGQPPPPMPPTVEKIMSSPQGQEALGQGMGIGSSGVTALPFIEGSKAVQSEVVQTELNDLVTQHKELVKLGAMYGKMDRGGKLIYLDQIEALEQRWGVFLKRFELMGELNPEFVSQTASYLAKLQIKSDEEFLALLQSARDIMRADADRT